MDLTLEKLNADLMLIRQRKEHTMNAFHQVCGAESVIEQMIAHLVSPEPATPDEPPKVEEDLPSNDQQDSCENQQADHQ